MPDGTTPDLDPADSLPDDPFAGGTDLYQTDGARRFAVVIEGGSGSARVHEHPQHEMQAAEHPDDHDRPMPRQGLDPLVAIRHAHELYRQADPGPWGSHGCVHTTEAAISFFVSALNGPAVSPDQLAAHFAEQGAVLWDHSDADEVARLYAAAQASGTDEDIRALWASITDGDPQAMRAVNQLLDTAIWTDIAPAGTKPSSDG